MFHGKATLQAVGFCGRAHVDIGWLLLMSTICEHYFAANFTQLIDITYGDRAAASGRRSLAALPTGSGSPTRRWPCSHLIFCPPAVVKGGDSPGWPRMRAMTPGGAPVVHGQAGEGGKAGQAVSGLAITRHAQRPYLAAAPPLPARTGRFPDRPAADAHALVA